MRKILFDFETTGFEPSEGHKIIEYAFLEIIDNDLTDNTLYGLVDPNRDIPEDSIKVHGITYDKVQGKGTFDKHVDRILNFIKDDSLLIAHNVEFDKKFLHHEMSNINYQKIDDSRFVDSLEIAKRKFPGQSNNLDALCRRLDIDLSSRADGHNALVDTKLLAKVYIKMTVKEELDIFVENKQEVSLNTSTNYSSNFDYRSFNLKQEDEEKHLEFVKQNIKNSKWY